MINWNLPKRKMSRPRPSLKGRTRRDISSYQRQCRLKLLEQLGKCEYCQKPLDSETATIDHIHPTSRGGKEHWTNYALSCQACNSVKSNFIIDELLFLDKIMRNRTSLFHPHVLFHSFVSNHQVRYFVLVSWLNLMSETKIPPKTAQCLTNLVVEIWQYLFDQKSR